MSIKKKLFLFLDLLMIVGLITLDQYTKYLAVIHLKDKPAYNIPIRTCFLSLWPL